jgi:hypothetical protein
MERFSSVEDADGHGEECHWGILVKHVDIGETPPPAKDNNGATAEAIPGGDRKASVAKATSKRERKASVTKANPKRQRNSEAKPEGERNASATKVKGDLVKNMTEDKTLQDKFGSAKLAGPVKYSRVKIITSTPNKPVLGDQEQGSREEVEVKDAKIDDSAIGIHAEFELTSNVQANDVVETLTADEGMMKERRESNEDLRDAPPKSTKIVVKAAKKVKIENVRKELLPGGGGGGGGGPTPVKNTEEQHISTSEEAERMDLIMTGQVTLRNIANEAAKDRYEVAVAEVVKTRNPVAKLKDLNGSSANEAAMVKKKVCGRPSKADEDKADSEWADPNRADKDMIIKADKDNALRKKVGPSKSELAPKKRGRPAKVLKPFDEDAPLFKKKRRKLSERTNLDYKMLTSLFLPQKQKIERQKENVFPMLMLGSTPRRGSVFNLAKHKKRLILGQSTLRRNGANPSKQKRLILGQSPAVMAASKAVKMSKKLLQPLVCEKFVERKKPVVKHKNKLGPVAKEPVLKETVAKERVAKESVANELVSRNKKKHQERAIVLPKGYLKRECFVPVGRLSSFPCVTCNFETVSYLRLKRHFDSVHLGTGASSVRCPHCDFTSLSLVFLTSHFYKEHLGLVSCRMCPYFLSDSPRTLKNHVATKHPMCKVCWLMFRSISDLRLHSYDQHPSCAACGLVLDEQSALDTHVDAEHTRCEMCDFYCASAAAMDGHSKAEHTLVSEVVGGARCTACDVLFEDISGKQLTKIESKLRFFYLYAVTLYLSSAHISWYVLIILFYLSLSLLF